MLGLMSAQAATIAVIDSGVDTKHKDLVSNIWTNALEQMENGRDEDDNGYQDDIYGWNFAENNNKVIDRKYLGTFSKDVYKFFEIQGKRMLGTATAQELEWMKSKAQDKDFRSELGTFGNFVHGTHVAGITVKNSTSEILSIKLLPTEVKPFVETARAEQENDRRFVGATTDFRIKALKYFISQMATQQMTMLANVADYVNFHKADIANGSFGTGLPQAKMICDTLYKAIFFKKADEETSNTIAKYFLETMNEKAKMMTDAAPNTLFVFAAGNDGTDNDMYPASPASVNADNSITVAATYKYNMIAPFSNYGEKRVDVAAPGMLINSQIPGDEYLKVSGTSQAAPYVANVAAKVKDANPELSPEDIKKVLIGTCDSKEFMKFKVKCNGIVNMDRAVFAAKSSKDMSLNAAISDAKNSIKDVKSFGDDDKSFSVMKDIMPIQMPSLFTL